MADKTRFPEGDVFADKAVRLNFTARADADVALDLHERADEDIVAEPAAVKIAGFYHGDVAPGVDVDDPPRRVMIADDITFLTARV